MVERPAGVIGFALAVAFCAIEAWTGYEGPFRIRTIAIAPPGVVDVVAVEDDGRIRLADGRTVRLFGFKWPEDPELRDQLRSQLWWNGFREGKAVFVREVIPGEIPAVEIDSMGRPNFVCGTCSPVKSRTWIPGSTRTIDVPEPSMPFPVSLMERGWLEWDPSDLAHPAADPDAVERFLASMKRARHAVPPYVAAPY